MAYARAGRVMRAAAVLAATVTSVAAPGSMVLAQDVGFGLGDAYRYYADPGNGGGSAYAPFFDPYRGNRIVRGAYPDASYDGRGYHYGKSVPPSLYVDPSAYDRDPLTSPETEPRAAPYRLRDGETMTTPVANPARRRHAGRRIAAGAADRCGERPTSNGGHQSRQTRAACRRTGERAIEVTRQ